MANKRDTITAIIWDDASFKSGVTKRSELPLRYVLTTYGKIVHEDDKFLSIAGEAVMEDSADAIENEYRQVTTIPKSLIRSRTEYRKRGK